MFRRTERRIALASALTICAALAFGSAAARADDYTVGTTADPTATACPSATATNCSLRQIIAYVHAHPFPPDTITVPAGTYTLNAALGTLVINDSMSIVGAGARNTTIAQPVPPDRTIAGDHVFYISAVTGGVTPTVSISQVEVAGGTANCSASSYGPLPVSPCFGGDVFNAGTLTLSDDWITNGFACSGAGVANYEGIVTIERSLISGNHSACGGADSGGIENFGCPTSGSSTVPNCLVDLPGHLVLDNSTVANNDARLVGGIFSWNDTNNTLTITNSTIAGNASQDEPSGTARGPGGGLGLGAGIARVENTIFAGNVETTGTTTTQTNCAPGPGITSFGRNIDSGTDCALSDTTAGQADMSNTNPMLGPLKNNGGPTQTLALLAGSPALDKVPSSGAGCPTTDQRGIPRPQGSRCDIGAFELQVPPTCGGVTAKTAAGGSTITVALTCTESAAGPLSFKIASQPAHGTLGTLNATGGVVDYTPAKGFSGTDTFTYNGTDSGGTSAAATVTITVPKGTPTRLNPTATWSFGLFKHYTTVLSMVVNGVTSGAKVVLTCTGKGCKHKSHTTTPTCKKGKKCPKSGATVDLSSYLKGWHLRSGAKLTLSIVKSGAIGKAYVFNARPPRAPSSAIKCVAPGSNTPGKGC